MIRLRQRTFNRGESQNRPIFFIANGYCPLSFRSASSIDYKKAMLIFYEQNNLYAFKQIFILQLSLL